MRTEMCEKCHYERSENGPCKCGKLASFDSAPIHGSATRHPWHEKPMWKKRLNGFFCYQLSSWVALLFPEEADRAMYKTLRDQFDGPNEK